MPSVPVFLFPKPRSEAPLAPLTLEDDLGHRDLEAHHPTPDPGSTARGSTCDHHRPMPEDPPKSEEKLPLDRILVAIRTNDAAAFRELYDAYAGELRLGIRCFIRKVPRLRSHEEDILGRAWVRLLSRDRKWLRAFDPERGSFTYFMRMVGLNTAWEVAALKGHASWWSSGEAESPSAIDDTDVEQVIGHRGMLEELSRRFDRELSDRDRAILEQVIVLGLPAKEVAEALEMTTSAVWTATNRLRKKLEDLTADLRRELGENERPTAARLERVVVLVLMGAGLRALGGVPADHASISCASDVEEDGR